MKIFVTLELEVTNAQVAGYLIDQVNANPQTRERGADALALDFAAVDFLLDAVAPSYPKPTTTETDIAVEVFVDGYYRRDWLKGFGLSATAVEGAQ